MTVFRTILTTALALLSTFAADAPAWEPQAQQWATGFSPAGGIAFDDRGTAYVCNYRRSGTIGRILADGTASVWCDLDERAGDNDSSLPVAVAVGLDGRVLVADAGNGRLLRIDSERRVETIASRFEGLAFDSVVAVTICNTRGSGPGQDIVFAATLKPTGEEAETHLFVYDLKTLKLTKLDIPVQQPISLTASQDHRWLVIVESPAHRLWRYPWRLDNPRGNSELDQSKSEETDRKEQAGNPSSDTQAEGDTGSDGDTTAGRGARAERVAEFGGEANPMASGAGLCAAERSSVFLVVSQRDAILEVHLESGETLRTLPLPGHQGVGCALAGGYLYVVIREKEAIFRMPLVSE